MEAGTQPSNSSPAGRGWWSRNWKWFVPTGCLALVVLIIAFVVLIALLVFGTMKSSEVYQASLARAKADPAVAEALGSPLKDGMFLSGKTSVDGASGEADLAIPISGPKGKGTLYVVASKSAGLWKYTTLVVEVQKTSERLDLIGSNREAVEQE